MSELSVLFDGALAARRVPSTGADREVLVEALVKDAGRKRTLRAVGQSVLVATAVAVVGLTSWAVVWNAKEPATPPVVTPTLNSPSPSATASPSLSAMPIPSVTPSETASPLLPEIDWGVLSDGIPENEYPPLATWRGDGFPVAHVMEKWVWDKIGPNWAVSIVASDNPNSSGTASQATYAFLISPEGRHFELTDVSTGGTTVIRGWHEASRTASIEYNGTYVAMLDLDTGAIEPASVQLDSGQPGRAVFHATSSSGLEWWWFFSADNSERVFASYSESAGWTPLEESHVRNQSGYRLIYPRSDLEYIDLSVFGDPAVRSTNGILVDLVTGTHRVLAYQYPEWAEFCYVSFITSKGHDAQCGAAGRATEYMYFAFDGTQIPYEAWKEPQSAQIGIRGLEQWVEGSTGVTFLKQRNSDQVYEIRAASGKVLASADQGLPATGVGFADVQVPSAGVARFLTIGGGIYVIDLERETLVAMVDTSIYEGVAPNARSLVFYGEGTDRRLVNVGYYQR